MQIKIILLIFALNKINKEMKTRKFTPINNGVTILNSLVNEEDEDYKEMYEDWHEEGESLFDFVQRRIEFECDDFWKNLRAVKDSSYIDYYVVTGELGLWDGNHTIVPVTFNNLYDALLKCATDAYDIVVKYEDNAIKFESHHHDGTNCFEVRNLCFDDYDKIECWDDDKDGDVFEFINKHAKPISWEMIGQE